MCPRRNGSGPNDRRWALASIVTNPMTGTSRVTGRARTAFLPLLTATSRVTGEHLEEAFTPGPIAAYQQL